VSIRFRLAAGFAIASAVLLALGSWSFVSLLSSSLTSTLDAQLIAQSALSVHALSTAPETSSSGSAASPPEYSVQIIDARNTVIRSSPDAGKRPLISLNDLAAARTHRVFVSSSREGEGERILAEPYQGHPGELVLIGVSLGSVDDAVNRVAGELIVADLIFVAGAGISAFLLARSALRPVDRLRHEVDAHSGDEAPWAVSVPDSGDEIAALAATMNGLLTRAHDSLERERNLVADASHELRTPFAVLRGELELAQRPGRTIVELREAIDRAATEAKRLTHLADNLLILARSDRGQLGLQPESVDVTALLEGSAERARRSQRVDGAAIQVESPPGMTANLDRESMERAIDNLIANALREAPAGTTVTVAARRGTGTLEFVVSDEGPGFDPGFLAHAFERFRRPDSSRTPGHGGAGLGLAIVRATALAHGGDATAANNADRGASVRITIPQ
jgi:two-component system OmpR family sensor kinase